MMCIDHIPIVYVTLSLCVMLHMIGAVAYSIFLSSSATVAQLFEVADAGICDLYNPLYHEAAFCVCMQRNNVSVNALAALVWGMVSIMSRKSCYDLHKAMKYAGPVSMA